MNSVRRTYPHGFTLLEVLVVVGIIGILTAILLPSMSRARSKVREISCRTNQRQITIAMTTYATDHEGGYFHSAVGEGGNDDLSYLFLGGYMGFPQTAVCPSTKNRVELKTEHHFNLSTGRFEDGVNYHDLIFTAVHAHDGSGGHSYELFHVASPGQYPNGTSIDDDLDITLSLSESLLVPSRTFICIDNDSDPVNGGINMDGLFGFNNLPDEATNNHGDRGGNVAFLDGHSEFISRSNWIRTLVNSTHVGALNEARAQELDPTYRTGPRTDGKPMGRHHYFAVRDATLASRQAAKGR